MTNNNMYTKIKIGIDDTSITEETRTILALAKHVDDIVEAFENFTDFTTFYVDTYEELTTPNYSEYDYEFTDGIPNAREIDEVYKDLTGVSLLIN